MPKFKKECVHFMWNDELIGKKVFYGDCISNLQFFVERGLDTGIVTGKGDDSTPFRINNNFNCEFIYYDPDYQGKLITNRQLAKWLAKGRGEYKRNNCRFTSYAYTDDDEPVPSDILIRYWDKTEWERPTVAYLGFDGI